MCGITGFVTLESTTKAQKQFKRSLASLRHRGPDSQGEALSDHVGIGMRRLSIVDVRGGDQPFYNEDHSIVIVGNGEIYNYPEIVGRVKRRHHLSSKSDIEIILHLYEDEGVKCLRHLKGMFAFALFDKKKNQLFIARDRWGEKPLYYTTIGQTFYFASELKALSQLPGVDKTLSPAALYQYFHYYCTPEPGTAFSQIHKLPAAHYALINTQTLEMKIEPYWAPPRKFTSLKKPNEAIRDSLLTAFRRTMMADVPVGIALSGGLDSSAIFSVLGPEYRDSLTAFTIGYEGQPTTDERQHAAQLAEQFGIPFIERELTDQEVVDNYVQKIIDRDDPVADIATQGVSSVAQVAKENGMKVLLSGTGGDELFWGYTWVVRAVERTLAQFAADPRSHQVSFAENQPSFTGEKKYLSHLYTPEFKAQVPSDALSRLTAYSHPKTELNVARHHLELMRDLWLQPDLLVINDRIGMAHSIEMRAPFLDIDLTELIYTSKQTVLGYKLDHKYWLKAALADILPPWVLEKKKQGFTPPIARWLFKLIGRYHHLLADGFLVNERILSPTKTRFINQNWWLWPLAWYEYYQLLVLEIWGRHYVYGQTADEITALKPLS